MSRIAELFKKFAFLVFFAIRKKHAGNKYLGKILAFPRYCLWQGTSKRGGGPEHTWLPMGSYGLPLSLYDHQSLAQGSLGLIKDHPEITLFQPTHPGLKTAKCSSVRSHSRADLGYLEIEPRITPLVGGSPIQKKKVLHDLGLNRHIVAAISQPSFDSCPPEAVPRYGGLRGQNKKVSVSQNDDFPRVRHPLGYATRKLCRGTWRPPLRLI